MKTTRQYRRGTERRKGAALVEFAIIAPVFLALVLGVLELGSALKTANTMTEAVRGGGRLACMDWSEKVPDGTTINQKVIKDVRNFLTASGLPGDDFTITITSAEGTDEGQTFDLSDPDNELRMFKIEASVDFSDVNEYPSHFMAGQEIKAAIVFRAGRVQLVSE